MDYFLSVQYGSFDLIVLDQSLLGIEEYWLDSRLAKLLWMVAMMVRETK